MTRGVLPVAALLARASRVTAACGRGRRLAPRGDAGAVHVARDRLRGPDADGDLVPRGRHEAGVAVERVRTDGTAQGRRSFLGARVARDRRRGARGGGLDRGVLPQAARKGAEGEGGLVVAGPSDAFAPGRVTAFPAGKFYLVRLEDGGFLALNRQCTHLGCSVPVGRRPRAGSPVPATRPSSTCAATCSLRRRRGRSTCSRCGSRTASSRWTRGRPSAARPSTRRRSRGAERDVRRARTLAPGGARRRGARRRLLSAVPRPRVPENACGEGRGHGRGRVRRPRGVRSLPREGDEGLDRLAPRPGHDGSERGDGRGATSPVSSSRATG